MKIPQQGLTRDEVFEQLESFTGHDYDWRTGKCYAYTFDAGEEAEQVAKDAFMRFMSKNALDPTFFPSVLELENRVVAMCAAHLGGDADTAGTFTSGGTESIILAVKTARDYFRATRPDITAPEMILPATAHAAFHKAAHYLDVKVVHADVNPDTFRVEAETVRRLITPRTILLVGSASCYAYGTVDPIVELGDLALDHGLLLHVDGCIGGFVLPFLKELGADIPDFDLSVPGVTSISMDLHKYAYAPKGSSVVLHKSADLRRHQIFACATWTGYTIVNTSVQSTKGAGPMAGSWAVLNFIGWDGYREIARNLWDTTRRLKEGIAAIPQLRLLGDSDMPLIAFTSDTLNVFHIIDTMNAKGWHIQAQLKFGEYQECIHLSVNPSNVEHTEAMVRDLRAVCDQVTAKRGSNLATAVSTMFGGLNPDRLNDTIFKKMIGMAGMQGAQVPEKMADINDIMNVLPPNLSERLLIEFINRLFAQPKGADDLPAPVRPYRPPRGPRANVGLGNGHAHAPAGLAGTALALARNVRDRLVDLGLPLPR
jgi:glutamate/tyrosine decarboxylase-like PLP-dependent enzyme